MMENINYLFLDYFNGKLNAEKAAAFESQLSGNPQLTNDYNAFVQLMNHISNREKINQAVSNLKQTHHEYLNNHVDAPKQAKRWNLVKAAILIIGLIGLATFAFWFINNKNQSPEMIYASNYALPSLSVNQRSNGNIPNINAALLAYQNEDFQEAANGLDTTGINPLYHSQILRAKALSLHELGNDEEALELLTWIGEKYSDMFASTQWYKAMINLHNGNTPKALKHLENIDSNSSYYNEATKILKEIK